MSGRLARYARRAARSRRLPPAARSRLVEEIRGHLEDAAAEYRALGHPPRQAERRALRDFGDPRRVRTDLGRAWSGRRVVLFPRLLRDHLAAFLVYDLKVFLLLFAVVLVLRWQVVAAYHIPTKSMEPTLHGDPTDGDRILVNKLYYHLHRPRRWQVAVFERVGDDRNLIKRIVGLPGETIDIRHGDIYIDGRIARKPRDVQEGLLVPVYRDGRDLVSSVEGRTLEGLAAWKRNGAGRWTEDRGRFHCTVEPGRETSLSWPRPVPDEYPGGEARPHPDLVGDLVLEFRVRPGKGVSVVGAELREGEDAFEVKVPVGTRGDTVLLRRKKEVARARGVRLVPGREVHFRFANLDDRVTLEIEGREVLRLDVSRPSSATVRDQPPATFGVLGGEADFREVTLSRDIHYVVDGPMPTRIPPGRYYMLGDNSVNSNDSRRWGTVPGDHLIGRPFLVFWPPARVKVLR